MFRCTICGRPAVGICQKCLDPVGDMYRQMRDAMEPFRSLQKELSATDSFAREAEAAMRGLLPQDWRDSFSTMASDTRLEQLLKSVQMKPPALDEVRSFEAAKTSLERFVRDQQRSYNQAEASVEALVQDHTRRLDQAATSAATMIEKMTKEVQQTADFSSGKLWHKQAKAYGEQMARAFEGEVRRQSSTLAELNQSLARERFGLDKLAGEMRTLSDRMYRDWQAAVPAGIDGLLGSASAAASVLRSIEVTDDGDELTVDGVHVDPQELEDFLAHEKDLRGNIDLEALARLVAQQVNPKRKAWYVVLLIFMLHQFIGFWVDIAANRSPWSERPNEQKSAARVLQRSAEQRASQAVEAGCPLGALQRIRLVKASTLAVRAKPARQSHRVGELHLGDVVTLVRCSQRSWALVEWSPEGTDVRLRGWVLARYLAKLHLPSTTATGSLQQNEAELDLAACQ